MSASSSSAVMSTISTADISDGCRCLANGAEVVVAIAEGHVLMEGVGSETAATGVM